MSSKILLVIVILIAVFSAFTFLGNKKTSTSSSTQKPPSINNAAPTQAKQKEAVVTVTLTANGFVPKDIAIKAGQRVVWINKSGVSATVSSDDHPTHQLYRFLNLGEFKDNSSLQVVFDKAGKFGYHDHYNASSIGTVTVE